MFMLVKVVYLSTWYGTVFPSGIRDKTNNTFCKVTGKSKTSMLSYTGHPSGKSLIIYHHDP